MRLKDRMGLSSYIAAENEGILAHFWPNTGQSRAEVEVT